jgi:hypothetical protein
MKRRTIQQLIQQWNALNTDTEMVKFIDSLTPAETKLLDMAIRGGLAPKEPAYMSKVTV